MDTLEEQRKRYLIQKELLKHGLAKSSDEALDKASEVMQGRVFSDKDVVTVHHPEAGITEIDDLKVENKKLHSEITNMNSEIMKMLEGFKDKMSFMEREMEQLKAAVINQRNQAQNRPVSNQQTANELEHARQMQYQENAENAVSADRRGEDRRQEPAKMAEPQSESEKRQRTGAYKPGDVDVSKMFYYGNK